ncbi:MAG: sialidase family protein [Crocinitomicaceae bacterium]
MRSKLVFVVLLYSFVASAQVANVVIPLPKLATYFYSQVEPSIYINPSDNKKIVAGSVMNDYYYSKDGGKTWKSKSIYSKYGVNGDPCLLVDKKGFYYYFHLSNLKGERLKGGIVCERSRTVKGRFKKESHTVVNGKYHDKQWAVSNPINGEIYLTWTQFDAYNSGDARDRSNILFSKSSDYGKTWSSPKIISKFSGDCKDDDHTAEGAVPAVGPNGEIYVSWSRSEKIYFNKSLDGGENWLDEEMEIGKQKMGWTLNIPGIYRCNGLPVTVCDLSNSPYKGTIYVNWSDQRKGENNTDIWIKKSINGGQNWSDPIKVNSDSSQTHQFLSWMTVDQATGFVYVVFYDRRNYSDNRTDVYLAVSKDGGDSFKNHLISNSPFTPNPKIFFGDYSNISVSNGMIRPIWTRLDDIKISLLVGLTNQAELDKISSGK